MANQAHLAMLQQDIATWNIWRREQRALRPDLRGANLLGAELSGVNFSETDLQGATLTWANLSHANFRHANLCDAQMSRTDLSHTNFEGAVLVGADVRWASLRGADLSEANVSEADLGGADLSQTNLSRTNFTHADLSGAHLGRASLIGTNLSGAMLIDCQIYGIAVWDVNLQETEQSNLIITLPRHPTITVDHLEMAQFIYLVLNNEHLRHVLTAITAKLVFILGRFTPERKGILEALRKELRAYDYVPVVFDFDRPSTRDLTETVSTLAHLARFLIVDLTDPRCVPYEVATIVPHCIVPVQPLLAQDQTGQAFRMFQDLQRRYHWVLPIYQYQDSTSLLAALQEQVIEPAEHKAQMLEQQKQAFTSS
jgi:uncharacterized protein YjbI with pentapeptide repeats